MSRLPYRKARGTRRAGACGLGVRQRSRGGELVNDAGGLVGPFNAWVHAPTVGACLADLGAALRFASSLEPRLLELAIITVGAHWKAEFEWWAHVRLARQHGISDPGHREDWARLGAGVRARRRSGGARSSPVSCWKRARLVDRPTATPSASSAIAGWSNSSPFAGTARLVSFTLNAFTVPLPPGVATTWAASKR